MRFLNASWKECVLDLVMFLLSGWMIDYTLHSSTPRLNRLKLKKSCTEVFVKSFGKKERCFYLHVFLFLSGGASMFLPAVPPSLFLFMCRRFISGSFLFHACHFSASFLFSAALLCELLSHLHHLLFSLRCQSRRRPRVIADSVTLETPEE